MKTQIVLALFCFGVLASPAFAKSVAGGWDVVEGDSACGAFQEFEGPGNTEAIITLTIENGSGLSLANDSWTTESGKKYPMSVYLDKDLFEAVAVGQEIDGKGRRGFIITFGSDFLEKLGSASSLAVFRDGRLVDHLSLKGSSKAIADAKVCLAKARSVATADAREKAKYANITKNPFDDPTPPISRDFPSIVVTDPKTWIGDTDYPAHSIRIGEEGVVGYGLSLDNRGVVTGCQILKPSKYQELNDATCRVIMRGKRALPVAFAPFYTGSHDWQLPKN